MDKLKNVKECLMAQLQTQLGNLANVDAKEMGEVVDMIKDLEEAIYYCTITKAMTEKEDHGSKEHYYYYPIENGRERMMDEWSPYERMYYDDQGGSMRGSNGSGNRNGSSMSSSSSGRSYYSEYPIELRDHREGRSPKARRMYMESKEMHHSKSTKMHDLEQYMKELSSDITEMIEEASPEEKELLTNKLNHLAAKIDAAGN